jgi:hypothetical protein
VTVNRIHNKLGTKGGLATGGKLFHDGDNSKLRERTLFTTKILWCHWQEECSRIFEKPCKNLDEPRDTSTANHGRRVGLNFAAKPRSQAFAAIFFKRPTPTFFFVLFTLYFLLSTFPFAQSTESTQDIGYLEGKILELTDEGATVELTDGKIIEAKVGAASLDFSENAAARRALLLASP